MTPTAAPVLFLLATCYYPTGAWEIFFTGALDLQWDLLERIAGLANQLITYYQASTTTAFGLASNPQHIAIRDASGTRTVAVEPWLLGTRA